MIKTKNQWEVIKDKGETRFIILYGMIKWGIFAGIVFFLLMNLSEYGLQSTSLLNNIANGHLLIYLAIFMVVGIIYGKALWKINNKKFNNI